MTIVSNDTTVVTFASGLATGKKPGVAKLTSTAGSRLMFTIILTVSASPVNVVAMNGIIANVVSLSLSPASIASAYSSTVTATFSYSTTLSLFGNTATLVAYAFFTDGSSYPYQVTQAMGLTPFSTNTLVATMAGITLTAQGNGAGDIISYNWSSAAA